MQIETINQILDITETIGQALTYVKGQIEVLQFERTFPMLREIIDSLRSVTELMDLSQCALLEGTKQFIAVLEAIVRAYDVFNLEEIFYLLRHKAMPSYKEWRYQVYCSFRGSFS